MPSLHLSNVISDTLGILDYIGTGPGNICFKHLTTRLNNFIKYVCLRVNCSSIIHLTIVGFILDKVYNFSLYYQKSSLEKIS